MGTAMPSSAELVQDFKAATFQADSALLRELGERLVGQPHIALTELIKNAYDADAILCTISMDNDELIFTDNDHGMTSDDFVKNWMTIRTQTNRVRDAFDRQMNADLENNIATISGELK